MAGLKNPIGDHHYGTIAIGDRQGRLCLFQLISEIISREAGSLAVCPIRDFLMWLLRVTYSVPQIYFSCELLTEIFEFYARQSQNSDLPYLILFVPSGT